MIINTVGNKTFLKLGMFKEVSIAENGLTACNIYTEYHFKMAKYHIIAKTFQNITFM